MLPSKSPESSQVPNNLAVRLNEKLTDGIAKNKHRNQSNRLNLLMDMEMRKTKNDISAVKICDELSTSSIKD